ncbi:MrcB family domain-containing protein [Micromonospora taraxaci]|uniref:MrcB family domain-containing protein n=1 Tax=Micromonospora taraxaci TaxID=1316803 RepID=UPI003C2E48D3
MTTADSNENQRQLSHLFEEILQLQLGWSRANTPEMQRRGVLVRQEGPALVRAQLEALFREPPFDLEVEGRDGTGLKTRVPWIRVYSKSRSPRATDGWYAVFLFAFDGSAVYLSLNQGTTVPGQFTMRPPEQLYDRVNWARTALAAGGRHGLSGLLPKIDLADEGLGRGYERGNVFAIRYDRNSLSSGVRLGTDLERMVALLNVLYEASGEPTWSDAVTEVAIPAPRPSLSDVPAFIAWIRQAYGPTLINSRQTAEQQARELLNEFSGKMSAEQALALGELFNTGEWGGVVRHNRFSPAFVGAAMQRLVDPLDKFNEWTDRVWRRPEDEALQYVDEILRDSQTFPGAGRSYPTMLMYLRDPARYAMWLQITHRGLVALHRLTEPKNRGGGSERYLRYCEAARNFAEEFDLQPQEIDAVLAEAARAADEESTSPAAEIASLVADSVDEPEDAGQAERHEYPLADVAAATHLPQEQLEEWVALLRGKKRQALFYGPPGTGKTFVAEQLGRHLAGATGEVETVQFHPSFSYEDFLEGLRPEAKTDGGGVNYRVRPGVFKLFCDRARDKDGTYVFIIDEINRAELGAVLGELMLLLEYRGKRLVLPYSQEKFHVPDNVVVLATMNTADRSLALVDFALRRRFHAFEMRPSKHVLESHFVVADRGEQADLVLKFFDIVQEGVNNDDFSPGHSYWMGEDGTAQGLYRVWRYELLPYLAEYWFEHRSYLDELDARVTKLLSEEA